MHLVIFITVGSHDDAVKLARALIKEKMAACANIVGGVDSIFWWEGKVEEAKEHLLIVKSVDYMLDGITKRVKELHSYANPEIIAVKVAGGSGDYLDWVASNVQPKQE